eukprot:519002_1
MQKYKDEGQVLEWYYAQCVCSATRTSILSSRYPLHTGIDNWIPSGSSYGLPLTDKTIADVLLDNDYETHAIGKWHAGFYKWSYTPTYRGFKSFYGYYSGGEDYFTHKAGGYYDFHDDSGLNCSNYCKTATEAYGTYSAFAYTTRAQEIIVNHSTNADTKNKPLFMYIAYQSVHAPAECPQSYVDAYNTTIANHQRRLFAGMVSAADEGIGNITKTLKKYGFLDANTILVFSSDNGGPIPDDHGGDNIGSSNWPLRGGKHGIWEGGVRVTGVIWATPDLIPKTVPTIGKNYTQLMHVVDWLPTLTTAAGIDYKQYINDSDGISHWETIRKGNQNVNDKYFGVRDNVYIGLNDPNGGPINDTAFRYKWLKVYNGSGGWPFEWYAPPQMTESHNGTLYYPTDDVEWSSVLTGTTSYPLYNLSTDPTEHFDISINNTDSVNQLIAMMQQLENGGIPQAKNDPNCPPVKHPNSSVGPVWDPWCGV